MILFSEKEKNEKNDDDNKCFFFANTHTQVICGFSVLLFFFSFFLF